MKVIKESVVCTKFDICVYKFNIPMNPLLFLEYLTTWSPYTFFIQSMYILKNRYKPIFKKVYREYDHVSMFYRISHVLC